MPFRLFRAAYLLCVIIAMSLFGPFKAQAQFTLGGYSNSHYAGIHGVPNNPASAAGTHYKWDVNIAGVNAAAGNTYIRMPRSILLHPPDSLRALKKNRDYFLDTMGSGKQFAWGNVDVMMPSVLYSIDELQSVAFTWRVRAMANGGNVNTDVVNFFAQDFPNPNFTKRRYDMQIANGSFHWWNEFGFTYARVLKDDGSNVLKGGVTLKLLSGVAAGYAQVDNATFMMDSRTSGEINDGTLKIGYSDRVANWEKPNMSNYKVFGNMGLGMDVGVTYEWRETMDGLTGYDDTQWNPEADDYRLRLGLSITDLGGITYKKASNVTDLDLRTSNINPDDLRVRKGESWQQYYRRIQTYFTPVASSDKFRMNTPAALNLMADYNIDGRFFVDASGRIALNAGKYDPSKTYVVSYFQVTPRYDSRYIGGYLPLSVNRNGQFDAGLGLRLGPLVIGSSTMLSNLFQKNKNRLDGFIALRIIPIKRGEGKTGCPAAQF
ncbi:DUF5723 family protein [Chitinophaga ginsengisoli]|uniref:DUF5723 domain-containing protein n=1 Tax=Chitinophaga ginsengisoli TaxID=363837 RepID=A0A2P8FNY6_9BACT|nr:DUF5723 family protein [Chitinophaga ginsengisoli]PSL23441.1 hypothetical protein CLV42_118158 [Chitinophaga ginsengisoli]